MNQPYARVNQPYATLTLASALREMFGVQLYENNARALLSRILSILNLDWLQHARSVRGVYEFSLKLVRVNLRIMGWFLASQTDSIESPWFNFKSLHALIYHKNTGTFTEIHAGKKFIIIISKQRQKS